MSAEYRMRDPFLLGLMMGLAFTIMAVVYDVYRRRKEEETIAKEKAVAQAKANTLQERALQARATQKPKEDAITVQISMEGDPTKRTRRLDPKEIRQRLQEWKQKARWIRTKPGASTTQAELVQASQDLGTLLQQNEVPLRVLAIGYQNRLLGEVSLAKDPMVTANRTLMELIGRYVETMQLLDILADHVIYLRSGATMEILFSADDLQALRASVQTILQTVQQNPYLTRKLMHSTIPELTQVLRGKTSSSESVEPFEGF